jgi:signal transduction histidine kinase
VQSATQQLVNTNDALLKTQQHLARSERLAVVGQMAASLAHEIGTPLNAISGHLELLEGNQANDTDSRRRIRIIRQQLDFIVGTVRRLLEWTHKRKVKFQPVNLEKLIRETLWLVGPTLEERSITAEFVTGDQLPVIEAEKESLQQVFLNLINNSVEAMPQGGRIEIATRLGDPSGAIEAIFKDSGPGIPQEDAQHLFEPMWTTKPSGSGFGLAIARETMAEHGGDIEVLADQSGGAAFRLTLPIAQVKTESFAEEEVMSHVA